MIFPSDEESYITRQILEQVVGVRSSCVTLAFIAYHLAGKETAAEVERQPHRDWCSAGV
jgi:hypothetical protein